MAMSKASATPSNEPLQCILPASKPLPPAPYKQQVHLQYFVYNIASIKNSSASIVKNIASIVNKIAFIAHYVGNIASVILPVCK
jgi:hypothetical protein